MVLGERAMITFSNLLPGLTSVMSAHCEAFAVFPAAWTKEQCHLWHMERSWNLFFFDYKSGYYIAGLGKYELKD